jgi:hypothetical protein
MFYKDDKIYIGVVNKLIFWMGSKKESCVYDHMLRNLNRGQILFLCKEQDSIYK